MQCKKCGYENMEGAQRCQKCGAPFGQAEQRPGEMPVWFGSRIIGLVAVIAAAMAMLGVFLPWAQTAPIFYDPGNTLSATASGWDLITGSGDVEDGAEPYAIMAFAGSIVLLLGAAWGFFDPQSKTAFAATALGALVTIAGAAWGWEALKDYVFPGINAAEFTISHRAGLYLTITGGSIGVIASIIGRLGTTERV